MDNTQEPAPASEPIITDIGDLLAIPTQVRPEQDTDPSEPASEPISTDVATFDNAEVQAIKATTATVAEATILTSYDAPKLASAIIDLGDSVITNAMPFVYQSFLSKEEKKGLKELSKAYRLAKANKENFKIDETQQQYLEIQNDLEEYEELLPLSDAEKNSLLEPLTELLKEINYQSTPKNALTMALLAISVPRTVPLIPLMFKKKK